MNKSKHQLRAAGDAVLFGDILTTRWYSTIQAEFVTLCHEIGVELDLDKGVFEASPEQAEVIKAHWPAY